MSDPNVPRAVSGLDRLGVLALVWAGAFMVIAAGLALVFG
jgi:hypothetical protein